MKQSLLLFRSKIRVEIAQNELNSLIYVWIRNEGFILGGYHERNSICLFHYVQLEQAV